MIAAPSQRFLRALVASHERRVRVGLYVWDSGSQPVYVGPVRMVDGVVSLDGSAASWRRLTGTAVLPDETLAALAAGRFAFNGELRVEVGIGFADGVDWVQLAQLRIEESDLQSGTARRTVSAFDRAVRVSDFPFVTPYSPRDLAGNQLSVVAAIRDIITTAFPSNAPPTFVVDPRVDSTTMPPAETSFTGERWDAVVKLGQSVGAIVHNDHLGRFVIEPQNVPNAPVATLRGGAGGTLVKHAIRSTRVEQYNAVGLTCESPSGDGIFVYVVDNDPTSPTFYDGPFGRKPYLARNDTITTVDAAIASARTLLGRKRSGARDLEMTAVYQPLLQPFDVISVLAPGAGQAEPHMIDSIELPLAGGRMTLKTHLWTAEPALVVRAVKGGKEVPHGR